MKRLWPNLISLAGGALMTVAFFLPWAQASFFGFNDPLFSARDLAEREAGWNLVLFCGGITLLLSVGGVVASFLRRPLQNLYVSAGSLLFSLVCGIFILRVWSGLQGDGVDFSWIQGATARDLALQLRYGIILELTGCALAVIGSVLAVRDSRQGLPPR